MWERVLALTQPGVMVTSQAHLACRRDVTHLPPLLLRQRSAEAATEAAAVAAAAAVAVVMTSQGQRVWVQGLLPNALLMSSLELLKFGPKLRRIRHLWIAIVSPSFSLFFFCFCFFFLFYGRQSQVPCDVSAIFVADLALVLLVYNLPPQQHIRYNFFDTFPHFPFPVFHFQFSCHSHLAFLSVSFANSLLLFLARMQRGKRRRRREGDWVKPPN